MKKFLKGLLIAAAAVAGLTFFGCPQNVSQTTLSLTDQINAGSGDVDFTGQSFAEDAAVNVAKTVSNLDMGGKTLTVTVSGVTLKNVTNAVVIADKGIGDGELTIDGGSVTKLTVNGGGSNSINIKDAKLEEVVAEKENVRLNLQGTSEINAVSVNADNVKVESADDVKIENVSLNNKVNVVTVTGGTITAVESADGATNTPTLLITGKTTIKRIDNAISVKVTKEAESEVTLPKNVTTQTVEVLSTDLDVTNVKIAYTVGDKFDVSGVLYVEKYSDGTETSKTLSADDVTVKGFDSSKEGTCTVTLTYGDKTVKIEVTIKSGATKIDVTNENYAVLICGNGFALDITDKFTTLPVKGEKVEVSVKGKVSADIANLYAQLYYTSNDDWIRIDNGEAESVKVAENVKAGVEFSSTVTFEISKAPVEKVGIQLYTLDEMENVIFENGTGLTSESDHVTVEATDDGLKVTLKLLDGEIHKKDATGSISVVGKDDITISTQNDDFGTAYDAQNVVYYYPFVEKGEECIVKFSGKIETGDSYYAADEIVKVTATAGKKLDDYISAEQRKRLDNIKVEPVYHENEKNFTYGFDSEDINSISDICNISELGDAGFSTSLVLGELKWADSSWWGGNNTEVVDGVLYTFTKDYWHNDISYWGGDKVDYFKTAKDKAILYKWKDAPTDAEWAKYNNHYCCNLTFYFNLKGEKFSKGRLSYKENWSELKNNPAVIDSTKNIDLDAAMTNGIKNLKKGISSEEELLTVVLEAFEEYNSAFTPEGTSRSVVTVPDGKALNINAAYKQILKVINDMIAVYNENVDLSDSEIKIDFDDTINLGELSFSQWESIVCKTYDAINKALYGMTEGIYYDRTAFGEIPEGCRLLSQWPDGSGNYYFAKYTQIAEVDTSKMPEMSTPDWILTTSGNEYGYSLWNSDGKYWVFTALGTIPEGYEDYEIEGYYWYKVEKQAIVLTDEQKHEVYDCRLYEWTEDNGKKYYGISSSITVVSSSTLISSLKTNLKENMNVDYDTLLSTLDSIVTIKNFYFDADIDVDFSAAKLKAEDTKASETAGKGSLALLFDGGISDVNKAINMYFNLMTGTEEAAYDLPVKAVAFDIEGKVDADVAYGDIKNIASVSATNPEVKFENSTLDGAVFLMVKASVCTANGNGGIITVEVNADADQSLIADFATAMNKLDNASAGNSQNMFSLMMEYAAKLGTVKITVSDGTNETFAKEYSAQDIYELVSKFNA